MPVGAFERQNGITAHFVIAHHRMGTVESRRSGKTACAERVRPDIEFERQAAAVAHRPIEEGDRLPAIGAEVSRLAHQSAAQHAQWRIEKIEYRAAHAARQNEQTCLALEHRTHVD